VPVVIVNIMNVIGERQDKEKFLPKIIEKVYKGEQMPIHAERGGSIGSRVYLHAKNVADALIFLSKKEPAMYNPHPQPMALPPWGNGTEPQQNYYEIQKPDRYNICGDTEVNNLEMALLVADIMGKELNYQLVQSHSARPGYDRRYMLDGTKLREAGWTAPMGFRESLRQVIDWTVKHPHWAAL
jgi:dTDP-glucose 4,6-dehydratase